jgi:hypothetical protein
VIRRALRNQLIELEKRYAAAMQARRYEPAAIVHYAYMHALQAAGVVLSGDPKIEEPLEHAQFRAEQRLNRKFAPITWGKVDPFLSPALKLDALFGADADDNLKFERIFAQAPVWFLKFTAVEWDAKILGFKLRELVGAPELGSEARRDRNWWPLLPEGRIDAGGSCSEPDEPWQHIVKRRCRYLALRKNKTDNSHSVCRARRLRSP